MQRRLIEQACGCSTVRGSGGLKVRACFCRWHSGGECLPPGPSSCTCRWFACCSGADLRYPSMSVLVDSRSVLVLLRNVGLPLYEHTDTEQKLYMRTQTTQKSNTFLGQVCHPDLRLLTKNQGGKRACFRNVGSFMYGHTGNPAKMPWWCPRI